MDGLPGETQKPGNLRCARITNEDSSTNLYRAVLQLQMGMWLDNVEEQSRGLFK
jgi:hypothetical protein